MILIDKVGVDKELLTERFCCDLVKCKGACCTFEGEFGAPVADEEVPLMEKNLKAAKKYLNERSLKIIDKYGLVEGVAGSYSTVCIDKKDCVFVYYEGTIAKCAFEKAYFEGESDFRKPVSCHLFPIRVGDFGGEYIYYEKIHECVPAVKKGRADDVKLADFLEDALTRKFGKEWYDKFRNEAK